MVLMVAAVAGVGGYLLAGGNESEQVTKSVTETINNVLSEFSTTISNQVTNTQTGVQEMRPNFDNATLTGCEINLSQTMQNTMSALSSLDNSQLTDLSNQLTNKLQETLEQQNEQIVQGLALGKNSNKQVLDTTTITENNIKSIIENTIENMITNDNSGLQINMASFKSLTCDNSTINITQGMVLEQISQNMASTIVENVVDNEALNDVKKDAAQSSTQKNEGLSFGIFGLCFLCCCSSCVCVGATYYQAKQYLPFVLMIIGFSMIVSGSVSIYYSQQKPDNYDSQDDEYKETYENTSTGALGGGITTVVIGVGMICIGGLLLTSGFGEDTPMNMLPQPLQQMQQPLRQMQTPPQQVPSMQRPIVGGKQTYHMNKLAKMIRRGLKKIGQRR